MFKPSIGPGVNPWKKKALDEIDMQRKAEDATKMTALSFPEASGSIPNGTVAVSPPRKCPQTSLVRTESQIPPGKQHQKQGSSEASKCTTQPFQSSKPNVQNGGTLKTLDPQIIRVPSTTTTIQTTTPSTLSAPVVGFGPGKPVFLHLLDLGLQLDQLCCQKNADQVTLDWIKESGVTDLTNIPNNPAAYDAFLTSPLPFHFDDNVLLAVHTMDGVRKHLWFCVGNQQLFWLIGCVPNMIET